MKKTPIHLRHPKTLGISLQVWKQYLDAYFDQVGIACTIDDSTLAEMHRKDASVLEVYHYQRTLSIIPGSAELRISWEDKDGRVEVVFNNNDQIRRFYQISGKLIKDDMEKDSPYKYGES